MRIIWSVLMICIGTCGAYDAFAAKSLYERLGKTEAIKAVVDQFVTNCATDDRINKFFKVTAADPKRLGKFKNNLVTQICQATGGPCKYSGKDMKTAHKGMGVTEADFNALVEDLKSALDKFNVGATEQNELLGALAGMKGDIVEDPAKQSLYVRLGKTDAIKAVVDEFVTNCATDDRINKFFKVTAADTKRLAKFKTNLVNQICEATGGPCKYTGKDMRTAHKGMGVSEDDFNALVEDLKKALDKFNVGEREQGELLDALATMKGDIVQPATLYSRLGGKDAITAVVDQFVTNCATDDRINRFFKVTAADTKRLNRFKANLVDQICQATGGPCKYTGKDMRTAHKGMGVSEDDFNALVEDLKSALDKFKVGDKEQGELLGALATMKGDIVGPKTLYSRLGGKEAITAVVDQFVNNCAQDGRINKFFAKTAANPTRLSNFKNHLVNQICEATGGPCKYTGKSMKASHRGMGVSEGDFTALVEDLKAALDKFEVGETEQNELLGALAAMKNDIVEKKTSATTATARVDDVAHGSGTLYERLGKMDAIKAVVNDFVTNCATDPRIKAFFGKTAANSKRLAHFKQSLIDQICTAAGGPCTYKGKDMKTAHRGMNITDGHFNALMGDLKKTLDKFNVGATEQSDLINALGTMRGEIVGPRG